jgi:hypothetical protein
MIFVKVISSMKKSSFQDAMDSRINVSDKEQNTIGYLLPVGKWILCDEQKIEKIRLWRQKSMRMFLTQFDSTFDKTLDYLKSLSIAQEGRLFFLLYDASDQFIGHLGLADVDGIKGELDNLMRGVYGGHPNLVHFAELALLDWSFKNLDIVESDVRVLSYNWMVVSLHEEVGYKLVEQIPLKKLLHNGIVNHTPTTMNEANVKYFCLKMVLKREEFYQINDWLK